MLKYDFVKNQFKKYDLILLEDEYKSRRQKMLCKTKDGYFVYVKYENLSETRKPYPFLKDNKFAIENFKTFLKNKNINLIPMFNNFPNKKDRIQFKCLCGNIFYSTLYNVFSNKTSRCDNCARESSSLKKLLSLKIVEERLRNEGYEMLQNYYEGSSSYIEVEDEEGYRGFITCGGISCGHTKISKFNLFVNEKYFIYNLNVYCKNNRIKTRAIKFIDKRGANDSVIEYKCGCGKLFYTTQKSFIFGGKNTCDMCSGRISSYEMKVLNWLEDENIKYETQKKYEDCKNTNSLPFDFYLEEFDILIEVDGEGHFFPISYNGTSDEIATEHYEYTKNNDEIKNNYCKENNIKLIRIPYYDIKSKKYIKTLKDNLLK